MNNHKKDFPIFNNNKNLVYLDSAATTQKPKVVIDAISEFYQSYNSNVFRGLYPIAEKATQKVEEVRRKAAKFINAKNASEIIFTRNTTESINLVAYSTSHNLRRGDGVITTIMEHHSNFVPWQQLCIEKDANVEILDVDNDYKFKIQNSKVKIAIQNSKLLAIIHASNVLGTINPIQELIKSVKKINPQIKVLVDAAQSVPNIKVDVQDLDCDFLAFSGHKMMAATGIGVLYAKKEMLDQMVPFMFGGEMVAEVSIKNTLFAQPPYKFEAGTPDISGIVSLGAAIDYINQIGIENIKKHDRELTKYCLAEMQKVDGLQILNTKDIKSRIGVISFNINKVHAHDSAQILGDMGICVRSGHHCAMPLHKRLGIAASTRASFYLYNDEKDIDKLIEGIKIVKKIFK
ncbi:MAG: SufS family cysteine desulfurase [bacterium]|nr:SufS family cysteine desulfurase [bacterium]